MFDLWKQDCQQLGISGWLGSPVPEGGTGKPPPVPVKAGGGAWPAIGVDCTDASEATEEDIASIARAEDVEGASETGADDVAAKTGEDDVGSEGGPVAPLPLANGL